MGRRNESPATVAVTVTLIALSLFSISATAARPCKTFLVSSYSISFRNPNDLSSSAAVSSRFVTVFTEIRRPNNPLPVLRADPQPASSSYVFASLRDRSRDILSVVVSLLLGVVCGALTAAATYFVWMIFTTGRYEYNEDGESDDQVYSPKKIGYVNIPMNPAVKEAN